MFSCWMRRIISSPPAERTPPNPMNSPPLSPLQMGDGDAIGAALLSPAFMSDLSTWTATIHKHGLLTQTVLVCQPPKV